MPTVDERLAQVRPKIERAKKHLDDLNVEILRFLGIQPAPYQVATKRNPDTRRLIYYLSDVKPVPGHIALIAGDVIQNLMSALDHLAYQLVCAGTSDNPPNPSWIYFPIQDDASKYEAKKAGKIHGPRPSTLKAIDALKPYRGGNDLLWTLYKLNNVEKHRLLITVGSMFQSFDLGAHMTSNMKALFPDHDIPIISAFFKPADVLFPLKVGDELFIDAPTRRKTSTSSFASAWRSANRKLSRRSR